MHAWQIFHSLWMQLFIGTVGVSAIAYFLLCVALSLWQNRLMFFPSATIKNAPSNFGLNYEEVWIPVLTIEKKMERINGWWLPASSPKSDVLLYLHGNGGNISANLGHARRFHQLGFSVLIIDYRGYGRSQGQFPTESELYRDAQAAWDYLVQERGINPHDIFIYGHSLGGAIAIDLAARKPLAAGLIVENTFTSMGNLLAKQGIFRFFPTKLLLTQRFDSLSKMRLLRMPLLFIHGKSDRTVPATMCQTLYNAAIAPKKLLIVPAAGHNNVATVSEETYIHAVSEFYQEARHHQSLLAV